MLARVTLLLFLLFQGWLYAQTPAPPIPPSPEAASVFKFSEVPVSYYAGLANTTIPFYEIKVGNLSIPIHLSYHARGIKVNEMAPRVGIGWSLNYGGMISRQARGKADDMPGGYLGDTLYRRIFTDNSYRASIWYDIVNSPKDFEPDWFMIDMPGGGGKFMFDQRDQSILQQQFSDRKIIPYKDNENGIYAWKVIDKDGNKYYFGRSRDGQRIASDYDFQTQNFFYKNGMVTSLGVSEERPVNTWHLMEIETVTNDTIRFSYNQDEELYYRRSYDDKDTDLGSDGRPRCFYSRVLSYQNQISEISFPSGKIKFIPASTEREDLAGSYALERVEVRDRNDSLIRNFSLRYDYPPTVDDNNQLLFLKSAEPQSSKRLFLKSILENGKGDTLPPYLFEYNPLPLPNRFSNSQDSWGYYNARGNGEYLTFFTSSSSGMNREVDTVASEAGMLKKIINPTGGSVNFTYEHNRGIAPGYFKSLLMQQVNPIDTITYYIDFKKHSRHYQNGVYSKKFTITSRLVGPITIDFRLPNKPPGYEDADVWGYTAYIEGNGQWTPVYPDQPQDPLPRSFSLPPGEYNIVVEPPLNDDTADLSNYFLVTCRYKETTEEESRFLYSAGKRIKRIEYKDCNNSLIKFREFEYKVPGMDSTSGRVLSPPAFYYVGKFLKDGWPVVDKYGSIPGSILNHHQGNPVGYSFVTEYFGDPKLNLGKTEYEFTIDRDGGEYYKYPYYLPIDNEWMRGKLLNTKIYAKKESGYTLVKEIKNKYKYAGTNPNAAIFSDIKLSIDSPYVYLKERPRFYLPLFAFTQSNDPDNIYAYNYKIYYQTGGVVDLDSTTEIDYVAGQSPIIKPAKYYYNYSRHYLNKSSRTINGKGDSVITRQTYPTELTILTPAEQRMVDSNYVDYPVKTEQVIKALNSADSSKNTTEFRYKVWNSNLILPELLRVARNSEPFRTQTQFVSYDSHGNPTEIVDKSGVRTSILWGYLSQHIVARVTGSDYATAKSFVNTAMLENAHKYTDEQIRTELNKIRTGLASSSAQVSTITYRLMNGMTSQTNPAGKTEYYEYDGLGRLIVARDNDNNILKKVSYTYNTTNACYPFVFSNTVKSQSFSRNNCTTGPGSQVLYTVPAGKYTSIVSLADAEQKAINDLNTNGQAYANANGQCPVKIFAKLTTGPIVKTLDMPCTYENRDITVKFYADSACTIPYNVTALNVPVTKTTTHYTSHLVVGSVSTTTQNYTANGNSLLLPLQLAYEGCYSGECPPGFDCKPLPTDPYIRIAYSLGVNSFIVLP